MPITKVYAKPGIDAIANYDYVDISTGTGVVVFNGFYAGLSGATTYHKLTDQTIYSELNESAGTIGQGNATINFNLTAFNKPQLVRGTAIVRFSADNAGGAGHLWWWDVNIQKVSASAVVTTIGAAGSTLVDTSAGNVDYSFVIPIVLTETNFKKGDNLRVQVIGRGNADLCYLGHDPANRDSTHLTAATHPTKFEVLMPFKIDA